MDDMKNTQIMSDPAASTADGSTVESNSEQSTATQNAGPDDGTVSSSVAAESTSAVIGRTELEEVSSRPPPTADGLATVEKPVPADEPPTALGVLQTLAQQYMPETSSGSDLTAGPAAKPVPVPASVHAMDGSMNTAGHSQPQEVTAAGTSTGIPGNKPARRHVVAGMESTMQVVREVVGWPLMYAEEGSALGVRWPRGLLLHGPPGCGKTALVQAIAEEFDATLHVVTAASVVGAYMGESERRLREAFEAAAASATDGRPAIVFLDEVDALCPRRDAQRQHEARLGAQLLTLLDGAAGLRQGKGGHVAVIAATNRPNAIDPALRRPGRLDREVAVGVPAAAQRAAILRLHTAALSLAPDVDLDALAIACHGYTGADLAALAREAAMAALSRAAARLLGPLTDATLQVTAAADTAGTSARPGGSGEVAAPGADPAASTVSASDFDAAMHRVGPSLARGAEVEVGPVGWDDIGGLEEVKQRLRQAVEWPLQHADAFQRLGLTAPRGVLLYGPPGCAKTTLARAAASASRATMMPLSCAQLYSMYVGEGEATLRDAFTRARLAAPSIIFLDEIDAVAGRREEDGAQGGSDAGLRLLSTLLTEMDGLELATGVLVLAATNRPQALDAALLRPGRFDALLLVPPPDEAGRLQALRVHSRGMPLAPDVDLPALAKATDLFTGAELAALCREAALAALREDLQHAAHVASRHFQAAKAALRPALTAAALAQYAAWAKQRGT